MPVLVPDVHLAGDFSREGIEERRRTGQMQQVRRAAYVSRDEFDGLDRYASERFRLLAHISALGRQLSLQYTVSHSSAAVVWGLPLVGDPDKVHLFQGSRPGRGAARDLVRHVTELPEGHRTVHLGVPVTTRERTIVDVAMLFGVEAGLILADAAMHCGASLEVARSVLAETRARRGIRAARAVLEYADSGSESPGETRTRLTMLRAGLPAPQTQVPVATRLDTFWADLGWPAWKVAIEYDGVAKYSAGGTAPDVVIAEKRRQEAMEEAGWRVIRVTAADLRDPQQLVARIVRLIPALRLVPVRDLLPR